MIDVAIIGGSFAGLAAALQLGRANRQGRGPRSLYGVFAAGDCASPAHSATPAFGTGAMAGVGRHQFLLFPDNFPPLEVPET